MSKGLDLVLEQTQKHNYPLKDKCSNCKEHRALEIIKTKSVNVRNLIIYCFEMNDTYEKYVEIFNYCSNYWELGRDLLAKEEYDLLKEVGL